MPKKLQPYLNHTKIPQFLCLAKRAQHRQRGTITQAQFNKLLRNFLNAQEIGSPLFGWFYANRELLKQELDRFGVSIRTTKLPNPSPFKTKERGFARLAEIERKIYQQQKRRKKREIF